MLTFIYFGIIFVAIPLVMIWFFVAAAVLPKRAPDLNAQFSGRAGFWAGLVVFAGYAVSALSGISSPDFNVSRLPSFHFIGAALGTFFGFVIPLVTEKALPSRGIGVLTLFLSAASSVGLFSYLFYSDVRDFTMYFALGSMFGVLMNIVFLPAVIHGIVSRR